ncbi:synaptonemal complex protein 2 [Neltuma alba]|uniref:synaptonemal complex protein 2 n=1 Tax=Neltuma alba TaxID=207710 RepID=UPI0010A45CBC|nr:synaptonemal complex protein 2-like [Prosopis alba]
MQKLGLTSSKSLDKFKSLYGPASGTAKASSFSSRPSTDSISLGSFANLKLTAEKLVKEQASVKTDLEIANTKLKKSLEHVHALEEKLRHAFNENAKLKVKQKEDEKLWKGLESKFSSTKTLCDQLTETMQQLSGLVQAAEKDKEILEVKLSASSEALDSLNKHMDDLSLKLDSAEETIRTRNKEIEELKFESVEKDKVHRDDQTRSANLLKEKDNMIKNRDETLAASKMASESLNSKLGEVQLQLEVKEDEITHHITAEEKLKKEMGDLQLCNAEITEKLDLSLQEFKNLDELVQALAGNVVGLDKESLNVLSKFNELSCLYDSCFHLVLQERDALSKHAQAQYDELHNKFLSLRSEKDAIQLINHELNNKVTELREVLEATATRHADICRLDAERIQCLESEAQTLILKKEEAELSISKLEERVEFFSDSSRSLETQMACLLLKLSALENESKERKFRELQEEILRKSEEIDSLKKEVVKLEQHADFLEKKVGQVNNVLEDKEQLILQYKEQEKKLEDQISENQSSLAAIESKLIEAKKQYDLMVESKQSELSRHLKEISQRNDQAINDIKRRYELEKMEIVNMEKEKADKAIAEIEGRCDKKLADCKEESRQQLVRIQEEHAALVSQIQQEHNKKQLDLLAEHNEKLKHVQLQAENELREVR